MGRHRAGPPRRFPGCRPADRAADPGRVPLALHADALLPAVLHRLAQPGTGCWPQVRHDLLHGLAAWHSQAADAAAALTGLLVRPGGDQLAIAHAPRRAGAAGPALDGLAGAAAELAGVLAWARWRITGERTAQTAQTLAVMAGTPPHGPKGLRLLADLGPAAA